MLIGAGSVRLRLLALRTKAAELEAKVEQRTQELARANTRLEGAVRSLAEKDALLHEDLLQAKAFQERILPRLPSGGAIRFRAIYRPADLVGGDVYDVCEVKDGHFRVFVADTTGHGVQASLRTMVLKTEYDRVKLAHDGPARVLGELNRKLATVYPDLAMRCSACCFDVIADTDGATLRYANAAHPPLLRVSEGIVDEIYVAATFLGVVTDATFPEKDARMGPADRLLAYTDGICEQEDDEGRAFGVERMEEHPREQAPRDAEEIVRDLDAALTRVRRRPRARGRRRPGVHRVRGGPALDGERDEPSWRPDASNEARTKPGRSFVDRRRARSSGSSPARASRRRRRRLRVDRRTAPRTRPARAPSCSRRSGAGLVVGDRAHPRGHTPRARSGNRA